MLRSGVKFLAGVAVAVVLAFPGVAGARDAGPAKSDITTTLNVMSQVTLSGHPLKPGVYTVKATDSDVTLELNGKAVAEAPVQWKDSTDKAKNSNLMADAGAIKEIHFGGKTKYVVIAE